MQPAEHTLIFSGGSRGNPVRLSGSFRKVARGVLSLLMGEEYKEIKTLLSSIPSEAKEAFFKKEGDIILNYAVVNSSNVEALKIITENIPQVIVQGLLRRNDFEILKNLVVSGYLLEDGLFPDTTEEAAQENGLIREKLQLLGRLDNELLEDFLKGHSDEKYMSGSVVEMISSVVIQKHQVSVEGP